MHVDTINDALEERDSTFHCIPRRCQLATSRSCCKDYVQRCWKRSSLELCGLKLELYSSLRYLGTLTRPVRMRSAPSRSTNLQPSQNAHNVSQCLTIQGFLKRTSLIKLAGWIHSENVWNCSQPTGQLGSQMGREVWENPVRHNVASSESKVRNHKLSSLRIGSTTHPALISKIPEPSGPQK